MDGFDFCFVPRRSKASVYDLRPVRFFSAHELRTAVISALICTAGSGEKLWGDEGRNGGLARVRRRPLNLAGGASVPKKKKNDGGGIR